MTNKITVKQYLIAVLFCVAFLYSTGFFIAEEYIRMQPEAYIVGATPPTFQLWEMY